jgi:hypothetical protein
MSSDSGPARRRDHALAVVVCLSLTRCGTLSPLPVSTPPLPVASPTEDTTPVTIDVEGSRAAVGRVASEHRRAVDFRTVSVRRDTTAICAATPCTVMLPRGSYLVQLEPVAGDADTEYLTPLVTGLRVGRAPTALRARLGYEKPTSSGGMKAAMWIWLGGALVAGFGAGALGLGLTGEHETEQTKHDAVVAGTVTLGISVAILAIGGIVMFASGARHRAATVVQR